MKKFVHLSATDSVEPDKETDVMKPYAVAKHFSDLYIENSNLNYTIVHPGPLQNEEGTGKIDAELDITRDPMAIQFLEDVATVLIETLDASAVEGKDIFIQTGQTDIKDAINNIK